MKTALLLLCAMSCAHVAKPGDACEEENAFCEGTTALICRAGRLEALPCRGQKGCTVAANREVTCDQSAGALPGDVCTPEYADRAQCAQAPASFLQCAGGRWVQLACPPGLTCHAEGGSLICR